MHQLRRTASTLSTRRATTGDARVALVFMRQIGTYDYVCNDDVEISDIPPCPEPIGLSLASATRTSATINWSFFSCIRH